MLGSSAALRSALLTAVSILGTLGAPLPVWGEATGEEEPGVFQFELLNGVYAQQDTVLPPVERGPLKLRLSSPEASLTLIRHQVALAAQGDGSYMAELEVEIEGQGDVVADFEVAGSGTQLKDRVTVPRQVRHLTGRIRFEAQEEGFKVTVLELPASLEIEMTTGIGASLLGLCQGVARVMPLDCSAVDRALTTAEVPLPPPGQSFELSEPLLTAEDRVRLRGFLDAAVEAAAP